MAAMSEAVTDLKSPMDLRGQGVIVTGGNRGIGFGISTAFAQRGARVAILCRNGEDGRRAAAELMAQGYEAMAVECDIRSGESVCRAAETAWAAFGRVDVLVNNAGISVKKPFLELGDDLSEFSDVVDVNLIGTARMTLACAKRMAGVGGCIINITSVGGSICSSAEFQPMSGYQASKAALNHLTKVLAVELGRHNIRVNAVAPGPTHSDLDEMMSDKMRNSVVERTCTRRFGEGIEVGAMCAYLASAEAAQIDGSIIAVDGGLLVKA